MENYTYEKIQELLNPIFEMMEKEYPNNAKLVIDRFWAKIVYEHTEMAFLKYDGIAFSETKENENG